MTDVCPECNGAGVILEGQFDDCVEVPCICVKTALTDARANEKEL